MKTDKHNDWTDAFRESFPDEARPAAGGWEAVAGRMRRAAARRRAAFAAAALALPITAGLIFLPSRPDTRNSEVAVAEAPVFPDAAPVIPDDLPVFPSEVKESVPSSPLVADITDLTGTDPVVGFRPPQDDRDVSPGTPTVITDGSPVTVIDSPVILSEAKDLPVQTTTNTNTVSTNPEVVLPGDDRASLTQGDLPDLFAEAAETPARARRLAIGLGAATTAGGTPTTFTTTSMASGLVTKASNNSSNNFFKNTSGTILQHNYVHDLPVSLGLTVRYGLTRRISLESGLDFTRMHSRLDGMHTVMLYAGIPLRVDFLLFSAGPVETYVGLGGKAERCLKATLGGMKVSEPGLQWSGSALLGAQARLMKNAWIYVQPDLTYYFTKSTLVSYRSENRLGLTVNAGLRFDISR